MAHTKILCALITILPLAVSVEELILTPLIKAGNLGKAREMATDNIKLTNIKSSLEKPATSYSGYLTINEEFNSNLFFWLFPAIENPETSSVILTVNSVPGVSLLQGIFLENGPFTLDENLELQGQNYTWARTHTLIFIDTPGGTARMMSQWEFEIQSFARVFLGFSFTDKEGGDASTAQDEDEELFQAMKQIYTLFPEYQSRDLYLAGAGFGGRVIPRLVDTFEEKGKTENFNLNIKGVIIGSPWIAPYLQVTFSDSLLDMGLIDEKQADRFRAEERKTTELTEQKRYNEVGEQIYKIHFAPGAMTYTETGFNDVHSFLEPNTPDGLARFTKFIDSNEVHKFLHVGLHKFEIMNLKTFYKFQADSGKPDTVPLEKLLDKGIKVLIYTPQFDFLVPRVGQERVLKSLNWSGKEEFQKAERKIWSVDNDIAGYVKTVGNLQHVMIRNAGYWAMMDQPKWCYYMVEAFTSGKML